MRNYYQLTWLHLLAVCSVICSAPIAALEANSIKTETSMSIQKQQVVDLLKAIETGAAEPVAVINPNKYIQHNLGAADGLAGFGALLQALPKGSARVNTVRVFQDGATFSPTRSTTF